MVRKTEFILTVGCLAAFAVAGASSLRHGAPLRERYDAWVTARAARKALERHWTELADSPDRLGTGTQVSVVEFLDFQCPYCTAEAATVDSVLTANPDLAIGVRQLPLPIHPAAEGAARAAVCAEAQGRFAPRRGSCLGTVNGSGTATGFEKA